MRRCRLTMFSFDVGHSVSMHDDMTPFPRRTRTAQTPARRILGFLALATVAIGAFALTGCTADASSSPVMTTGAGPTGSATSTPRPTTTAGASGSTATSAPVAGSGPSASTGTGATATPRCLASQLAGSTRSDVRTDSDVDVAITLTNTSTTTCTVQGWPGASVVGGENGTQLGRAAALDRSAPHPTVALQPRSDAHFVIRIVRPGDVSNAVCIPRVADGFRVIPPGETHSIFVEAPGYVACSADIPTLLTVTALVPGPAS